MTRGERRTGAAMHRRRLRSRGRRSPENEGGAVLRGDRVNGHRIVGVKVGERSPRFAVRAPGREPRIPVEDLPPTRLTKRHRRRESPSARAKRHRQRRAQHGVRGRTSAVRATRRRSGDSARCQWSQPGRRLHPSPRRMPAHGAPRRMGRHVGHNHQSGIVPGNRSGSPGNIIRQRPHCRGATSSGSTGRGSAAGSADAMSGRSPAPPEETEYEDHSDENSDGRHRTLPSCNGRTPRREWVQLPRAAYGRSLLLATHFHN